MGHGGCTLRPVAQLQPRPFRRGIPLGCQSERLARLVDQAAPGHAVLVSDFGVCQSGQCGAGSGLCRHLAGPDGAEGRQPRHHTVASAFPRCRRLVGDPHAELQHDESALFDRSRRGRRLEWTERWDLSFTGLAHDGDVQHTGQYRATHGAVARVEIDHSFGLVQKRHRQLEFRDQLRRSSPGLQRQLES